VGYCAEREGMERKGLGLSGGGEDLKKSGSQTTYPQLNNPRKHWVLQVDG